MKKLFTLFAVAAMAFSAHAASLTVCDATDWNAWLPIYGLYNDTEGTIGQVIYPADMLTDMRSSEINGLVFYAETTIKFENSTLQLALKEVDEDGFETATAIVGATAVAKTYPAYGDTELAFEFDEPFYYEGGNLLVEVSVLSPGSWATTYFIGTNVAYNAGMYHYVTSYGTVNDYLVKFLPKATFDYEPAEAPVTYEAPEITWTAEDGVLTVTATGEGFIMLTIDEYYHRSGDGEAVYTTTYDPEVGITVEAEACVWQGEPVSEITSVTIVVPPVTTPTEKTGSPFFSAYSEDGIYGLFLDINESEPSTIYYRIQNADGEYTAWMEYDGTIVFTEAGWYRVEAYAVAEGKLPSDPIAYEFVLSEKTGVLELVSGKQVANVRYFNLAGQEMQQANGLTIMVTTYTDGTTSAVKVMK